MKATRSGTSFGQSRSTEARSDVFKDVSATRIVEAVRRDGYFVGLNLPKKEMDEVRAWCDGSIAYGNGKPNWGYKNEDRERAEAAIGKKFTLGFYFNSHTCPTVQRLNQDPLINAVARAYIGPRARHVSTSIRWSYATTVPEQDRANLAQAYHFDLDDYRFMKFFFYLTDVDSEAGPHTLVRATHRNKRLSHLRLRRYSDAEMAEAYGNDRVVTITGPAGSGFVEDTFGLHKGTAPKSKPRLLFELQFAQRHYGFGDDVIDPSKLSCIPLP